MPSNSMDNCARVKCTRPDVLKAVALGAKACMIGRPYMYGLAAMGGAGVAQALQLLRNEIDLALVLSGNTRLAALDRNVLFPASA